MMTENKDIKKPAKKRDRIGVILYVFYVVLLAASILLIGKIACIQMFFNPDKKITEALTPKSQLSVVEPARGNIIDAKGRLLAISCPIYQIYMDCTVLKDTNTEEQENNWLAKAKELSVELARVFPEKTADQYYSMIRDGRKAGKKYVKIGHAVERKLFNEISEFPLFCEGRYKSGMIVEQRNIRQYPYGKLARRTIGFVRDNRSDVGNTHIGLEGKFDSELHGTEGREWFRNTDFGKVRDNDSTFTKAIDGMDLRTTINIDYQDIADKSLRSEIIEEEDLEGATLVLMEVGTGAIRAMINLVRDAESGNFEEIQNLAVGRKGEPGSVFKTVTLMSVLNDGFIKSLDEKIPTNNGKIAGTGVTVDQHIIDYQARNHTREISIIDGFKMSSNYVFGTLAVSNYKGKKGAMRYIENIHTYNLADAFDFDLDGLLKPTIPTPETRYWTDTDLATMGYGYSTEETPLHILTFYNAIANKGKMMKPYLVEDIEQNGIVVKKRGPVVLNASICSKAVADTMNRALKAVIEEGTAKRLRDAKCEVAGKTGTSFGTFEGGTYSDAEGRRKYQGTFAGYFPADNPAYSVICTVYSSPTHKSFQGGGIPARAIKKLIDGIYSIDPAFRTTLEKGDEKHKDISGDNQ